MKHIKIHINRFVKFNDCRPLLVKAPFVRSGCPKRKSSACRYRRQLYEVKYTHEAYRTPLAEVRTGITFDKEIFCRTDRLLTEAVGKGQHIINAVKALRFSVSVASVYKQKPLRNIAYRSSESGRIQALPHP